jgi:hypothetical protein
LLAAAGVASIRTAEDRSLGEGRLHVARSPRHRTTSTGATASAAAGSAARSLRVAVSDEYQCSDERRNNKDSMHVILPQETVV